MWDVDKAVKHLDSHGHAHSLGQCARYVRQAVEAGGVRLTHHTSAKDYGDSLTAVGFQSQGQFVGPYQKGDVAIIQPIGGHPHGHATMYDGKIWVSDFKQLHGLYPGAGYRKHKPAYAIYRYPWAAASSQPAAVQP